MKRYKIIINSIYFCLLAFIAPIISSCSSDEPGTGPNPEPEIKIGDRTILVYIVASNSLGAGNFDNYDIKEMQTAARQGGIGTSNHLVVFHQDNKGNQILKEIKATTGEIDTLKIYHQASNGAPTLSGLNSKMMKEVISDMRQLAPSNDYGLILWSHALGWTITESSSAETYQSKSSLIKPLTFGEDGSGSKSLYMNTSDLGNTLRGEDFSFIYFDCCYMASVEVFYDMTGTAPYIGASAAEIIAEGMAYDVTLPHLFSKKDTYFIDAVKANYEYVNAKTGEDRTGTFSIADMSKIDDLADACRELYSFNPTLDNSFIPQKFMYESTCYFFDLAHYIENLEIDSEASESQKATFESARKRALEAINSTVIYKSNTPYIWPTEIPSHKYYEVKIDHHCGLTTQVIRTPNQAITHNYNKTAWWANVASYLFKD